MSAQYPVQIESGDQPRTRTRRSLLKGTGATAGIAVVAFSLNRWSTVFAGDATPVAVQWERDVVYGEINGEQLLLDVVSPPADLSGLKPAVILMHGGALVFGDRTDMSDVALALAEAGFVAFNIEYRLYSLEDGTNPWPTQLDDVQRAVRWIRANAATYEVDPERIASFGHSAGGQLAAFLGTRDTRDNSDQALAGYSSRVASVVDIAGDVDMTIPFVNPQGNDIAAAILGGTADTPPDAAAYLDFSPITFVDQTTAPFLIFHGSADENVSVENSRNMADALHTAEVEAVYAELPGLDHFSIFDWQIVGPETLAFLGRHLDPGQ